MDINMEYFRLQLFLCALHFHWIGTTIPSLVPSFDKKKEALIAFSWNCICIWVWSDFIETGFCWLNELKTDLEFPCTTIQIVDDAHNQSIRSIIFVAVKSIHRISWTEHKLHGWTCELDAQIQCKGIDSAFFAFYIKFAFRVGWTFVIFIYFDLWANLRYYLSFVIYTSRRWSLIKLLALCIHCFRLPFMLGCTFRFTHAKKSVENLLCAIIIIWQNVSSKAHRPRKWRWNKAN